MSGNHSRRKGASYERELVHLFADAMKGCDVKRGLQSRSGQDAPDVDAGPLWVEAKRGKKPGVRAALRQATEASGGTGRIPVAVIRDDRAEAFVALSLDDFIDLVREWWQLKNAPPDIATFVAAANRVSSPEHVVEWTPPWIAEASK